MHFDLCFVSGIHGLIFLLCVYGNLIQIKMHVISGPDFAGLRSIVEAIPEVKQSTCKVLYSGGLPK